LKISEAGLHRQVLITDGEKVVKTSEEHISVQRVKTAIDKWIDEKGIHLPDNARLEIDVNYSWNCETASQWTNYYSAIQDADTGLIRIYYSAATSLEKFQDISSETWYTESPDGVNFSKPKSLHGLHAASSNFHVFRDPLDTEHPYKAVGGQHLRIDHHKKSGCKSKAYQEVWGKLYAAPADNHTCNGEGIYLFQSKDGIEWEQKFKQPIVTGLHEGQTDGLRGISEFDSAMSVLFDYASKHYYLYVRLNIKGGVRYIQYTKSKNLKDWSPFKPLKINNFEFDTNKHNFYYPHFFNFKNRILGYTAFYEEGNHSQKDAGIYLLTAKSPEEWTVVGKIKGTEFYNEEPHGPKSSRFKNDRHTVNGLTEMDGKYYLYTQSNYYNFHSDKGCYLERHEIDGSYI
jgi:hypothetical protein